MLKLDPQLVATAQAGDEQAIGELLVVCQPDLKRFARRVCQTTEDAEDAVQVALWAVHKKLGMLKNLVAITSWLFRIIERECYRFFHQTKRYVLFPEAIEPEIATSQKEQELHRDLSRTLALLPEKYRVVLLLRDVEELTAPEVAEQLGITIEAVKSRLHRARIMVRQALEVGGYQSFGE